MLFIETAYATVFTIYNPNQAPVYAEADKTICCGVCTAGEVSMSVSADRKGYCPGERAKRG